MLPFHARTLGVRSLLVSAVLSCFAACDEVAYVRSPPVEPAATAPSVGESEVVYVQAPPVPDIESYRVFHYAGGDVHYVRGHWFTHGPNGWAYYVREPAELAEQREALWQHGQDPWWNLLREGGAAPQGVGPDGIGVTQMQPR